MWRRNGRLVGSKGKRKKREEGDGKGGEIIGVGAKDDIWMLR